MIAVERETPQRESHSAELDGTSIMSTSCGSDGADAARGGDAPSQKLVRGLDEVIVQRLVCTPREDGSDYAPIVLHLADLVVSGEDELAATYLDKLQRSGLPLEHVYLNVLAPTARRLGELWLEDRCHFSDVTLGVCRLQQALHRLEGEADVEQVPTEGGRRILLLPAPGEQHGFGLALVAAVFRQSGWDVWVEGVAAPEQCKSLVQRERFDVVGISVSCSSRFGAVADVIRTIRRRSRNRHVGVLVGGPALIDDPDMAYKLGADATAPDAHEAVVCANELVTPQEDRQRLVS